MALIKDYEMQGTGVTVPNAYHVITDLKVKKRIADIPLPPDNGTASGFSLMIIFLINSVVIGSI